MSVFLRFVAVLATLVAVGFSVLLYFNLPTSKRTVAASSGTTTIQLRTLSYEDQMNVADIDSIATAMDLTLPNDMMPGETAAPQNSPSRTELLIRIRQLEEDLEEHSENAKGRVTEVEENLQREIAEVRKGQREWDQMWNTLLGIIGSLLTAVVSEMASNWFSS